MHWENSGPKQAAWTQNKSPPTHKHYSKPIYKHYLYFVHMLAHANTCTHSHWASSCWELFRFTLTRMAFYFYYWKSVFPLRVPHTSVDLLHSDHFCCWDCQSYQSSSSSSLSWQPRAHLCQIVAVVRHRITKFILLEEMQQFVWSVIDNVILLNHVGAVLLILMPAVGFKHSGRWFKCAVELLFKV